VTSHPPPAVAAAPARVLVVDDEEAVRRSAQRVLAHLGCETEAVASAKEAWVRLMGEGPAFDLAMVDLSMPGMTGAELVQRLREARCELPVLLVSGYANADSAAVASLEGDARLDRLEKPYRVAELRDKLERLLRLDRCEAPA